MNGILKFYSMGNDINSRINELYKRSSCKSIRQYALKIGVPPTTLNECIKGSEPRYNTLKAILDGEPSISYQWLMTGEGKMEREIQEINSEQEIQYYKTIDKYSDSPIPLYDVEAAANLEHLLMDKDQHIIGELTIPNLPVCDGAIYVKGDSMYPLLKSGDIVIYKQVPVSLQYIYFGEMYLISIDNDGDEYLAVKYVNKSDRGEEWIKLVSYNTHHEPKDFHLSSVRALALIKASVRINTMR